MARSHASSAEGKKGRSFGGGGREGSNSRGGGKKKGSQERDTRTGLSANKTTENRST